MSGYAKIELTSSGADRKLVVNGDDITKIVRSVVMRIDHDDVPHVGVEFTAPDVVFVGEGIVERIVEVEGNPLDVIRTFLDSVDAEQLERDALLLSDFSDSPGAPFIKALKKLVES